MLNYCEDELRFTWKRWGVNRSRPLLTQHALPNCSTAILSKRLTNGNLSLETSSNLVHCVPLRTPQAKPNINPFAAPVEFSTHEERNDFCSQEPITENTSSGINDTIQRWLCTYADPKHYNREDSPAWESGLIWSLYFHVDKSELPPWCPPKAVG